MDNDLLLWRKMRHIYKAASFKFSYIDKQIYNEVSGNNVIKKLLSEDNSVMISRFGAVEARCVSQYLKKKKYSAKVKENIQIAAGVFPSSNKTLDEFCEFYLECAKQIDVLAVWQVKNERLLIDKYCKDSKLIRLRSIEPYYFQEPWSEILENKRVLVVHPFAESIGNQYKKRELIFKNKKVLPEFKKLETLKSVQSAAGQTTNFQNWFHAYDYMCSEIEKKSFDIAIIGAGAYGLPLACFVKKLGKKAVHMAGSTQLLFGIKGKRWDDRADMINLYNDNWVRPLKGEIPIAFRKVEGGSYW